MGTEFKALLEELRKEKGLSKRELARRAGLDIGYYWRAENGKIPISNKAVLRIAEVLHASPSKLLIAAQKLRQPFSNEPVTPGARLAFGKLANGERLNGEDNDSIIHVLQDWGVLRPPLLKYEDSRVTIPQLFLQRNGANIGTPRLRSSRPFEEREAQQVLAEFAQRYEMPEGVRTPIRSIVKNLFHLTCRVGNLEYLGAHTLGGLLPAEGEIWVSDQIRDEGAVRFTIAHEFWHFLHWCVQETWKSGRKASGKDRTESRADAFAAAILMPDRSLRAVVDRWELKDPVYRYALAKAYEVSVQAMEWRLLSLRLVGALTLAHTYMPVKIRARKWRPGRRRRP